MLQCIACFDRANVEFLFDQQVWNEQQTCTGDVCSEWNTKNGVLCIPKWIERILCEWHVFFFAKVARWCVARPPNNVSDELTDWTWTISCFGPVSRRVLYRDATRSNVSAGKTQCKEFHNKFAVICGGKWSPNGGRAQRPNEMNRTLCVLEKGGVEEKRTGKWAAGGDALLMVEMGYKTRTSRSKWVRKTALMNAYCGAD